MAEITKEVFEEIKSAQNNGLTSKECAEEMRYSLKFINELYGFEDYEEYKKKYGIEDMRTKNTEKEVRDDLLKDKKKEIQMSGRYEKSGLEEGYFRKISSKNYDSNNGLEKTQLILLENVAQLWKMIRLLEWRKKELETYVASMESYLKKGSDVLDELALNEPVKPTEN